MKDSPVRIRALVEVAEALDVPRTAREVQERLGIAPASVYRRLLSLAALGRVEVAELVRVGRRGAGAVRWRRVTSQAASAARGDP